MLGPRYLRESVLWIAAFVLAFELCQWLARLWPEGSPWRLLALAPAVAAIGAGLWVELRQVARMDELQRLMYLVATLTGAMFAVLFCAVAYIGEVLRLWARIAPIYAIAALGLGFLIGWLGARRRYA
jgi:hypothetical protein